MERECRVVLWETLKVFHLSCFSCYIPEDGEREAAGMSTAVRLTELSQLGYFALSSTLVQSAVWSSILCSDGAFSCPACEKSTFCLGPWRRIQTHKVLIYLKCKAVGGQYHSIWIDELARHTFETENVSGGGRGLHAGSHRRHTDLPSVGFVPKLYQNKVQQDKTHRAQVIACWF